MSVVEGMCLVTLLLANQEREAIGRYSGLVSRPTPFSVARRTAEYNSI